MSKHFLDTSRLMCPMPVIRTQNRITELQPGELLEVLSTDHGALNDIPAWCRINGHKVLETRDEGAEVFVLIEVGEG